MLLKVTVAASVAANTPFVFTVPGHETWQLRSVLAVCSRAAGGTPGRSYSLTIANGAQTLVTVPAADAGTDPGTCTVTWANVQPASSASGSTGISVSPLGHYILPAGYTVTGTILGSVAGDKWTSAVAWLDYVLS